MRLLLCFLIGLGTLFYAPPVLADGSCANVPITSVPVGPIVNANLQCDASGNLKVNIQSGTVSATQPYTASYGQTAASSGSFTGLAGFSTFGGGSGVDAWTFGPSAGPSGGLGLALGTPGVPYIQGIGPFGSVPIFSSTGFPISNAALTTNVNLIGNSLEVAAVAGTSVLTNVAAATTSTQCLAANTARRNAYIYNDSSSATLYVAFAASASTTAYTFQLVPQAEYEFNENVYTGAIYCIWSAAVGNVRITEITQ